MKWAARVGRGRILVHPGPAHRSPLWHWWIVWCCHPLRWTWSWHSVEIHRGLAVVHPSSQWSRSCRSDHSLCILWVLPLLGSLHWCLWIQTYTIWGLNHCHSYCHMWWNSCSLSLSSCQREWYTLGNIGHEGHHTPESPLRVRMLGCPLFSAWTSCSLHQYMWWSMHSISPPGEGCDNIIDM